MLLLERWKSSQVADNFAGGVGPASSREAVAGMRARAAEEKSADGRLVARPIENRTHREELVESQFTVENVAAGETIGCFEIFGRDDLNTFDKAWKIWCVDSE